MLHTNINNTSLYSIAKRIIKGNYVYAGVRALCKDEYYKLGDVCRASYEWDRENDCSCYYTTGETAGGTCATMFNIDLTYYDGETEEELIEEMVQHMKTAIEKNSGYIAENGRAIIAGYSVNRNYDWTDESEIRIVDAEVVGLIK